MSILIWFRYNSYALNNMIDTMSIQTDFTFYISIYFLCSFKSIFLYGFFLINNLWTLWTIFPASVSDNRVAYNIINGNERTYGVVSNVFNGNDIAYGVASNVLNGNENASQKCQKCACLLGRSRSHSSSNFERLALPSIHLCVWLLENAVIHL